MAPPKLDDVPNDPDMGLHPNGTYYVLPSALGKGAKGPRSTGEKDFRRAVEAKREMLRVYAKLDPDYQPVTYEEVAERAWSVRQTGGENRDSTKYQARPLYDKLIEASKDNRGRSFPVSRADDNWWLRCLERWRKEPTEGVDPETGKRWKKRRRTTFKNLRQYAIQIDRYAHKRGWKKDLCDFPLSDPKAKEGKVLSNEDFGKLVEKATYRMRAFLVCARYMGMRRSEILRLELDRVDLVKGTIELRPEDTKTGSKTKKGRKFAIAPEAMPYLTNLAVEATAAGVPWLFPNRPRCKLTRRNLPPTGPLGTVRKPIARLVRVTGVKFRPHDLRHTFLTVKLLVEKLPPMDVAIFAGVSLQVMQDTYLHATDEHTRHVVCGPSQRSLPAGGPGGAVRDVVSVAGRAPALKADDREGGSVSVTAILEKNGKPENVGQ